MEIKVGIDLDGVIGKCAEYVIDEIYMETGRIVLLSDLVDHKMSNSIPEHMHVVDKIMTSPDLILNMEMYSENIAALNYVREKIECDSIRVNYHIITARRDIMPNIEKNTRVWMDRSGMKYDKLSLVEPRSNKTDIAKENEIDIFVEDRLENAIALDAIGIKCILIDRPWNQDNISSTSIVRVRSDMELAVELHDKMIMQITS
jgi:uncharacterized HAD superfamily protein